MIEAYFQLMAQLFEAIAGPGRAVLQGTQPYSGALAVTILACSLGLVSLLVFALTAAGKQMGDLIPAGFIGSLILGFGYPFALVIVASIVWLLPLVVAAVAWLSGMFAVYSRSPAGRAEAAARDAKPPSSAL